MQDIASLRDTYLLMEASAVWNVCMYLYYLPPSMINDVILTGHFRVEFNAGCYIAFESGMSVRIG